ncbi:MAG: DNA-3-methyladenine glycosylase I [Candidatus Gastranaerophilales bacterium]|nr:DNA-3-methyladenine glycosylase I [Candidatus Gastranaerophilales bacterium]
MQDKKRCKWVPLKNQEYVKYHDEEWGVAVYDDKKLFEMLILEGAQAGLSWETVLKKRNGYKQAFKNFDVEAVSKMTDDELHLLMNNSEIIRNRLKIFSARKNAIAFIDIQKEFGSFSNYIWDFVDNKPIVGNWDNISQIPTKTDISDKISKDLKKRGMSFVGSTIIYSYMQAVGLVNDHTKDCWKF